MFSLQNLIIKTFLSTRVVKNINHISIFYIKKITVHKIQIIYKLL